MNEPTSAVVGGAVAVAALSVALLVIEVETRSRIGVFDVVARFVGVPGNVVVGFALPLWVGSSSSAGGTSPMRSSSSTPC